jgi:hypothetical protein
MALSPQPPSQAGMIGWSQDPNKGMGTPKALHEHERAEHNEANEPSLGALMIDPTRVAP